MDKAKKMEISISYESEDDLLFLLEQIKHKIRYQLKGNKFRVKTAEAIFKEVEVTIIATEVAKPSVAPPQVNDLRDGTTEYIYQSKINQL